MEHDAGMLRLVVIALIITLGAPAFAQPVPELAPIAPSVPSPTPSDTASSTLSDSLTLTPATIGPATGAPFGPITSPSDPFGATPTTALPPDVARNAEGVRAGPGSIYPAIGVALKYDDNIFLSNANRQRSWVTVISPALRAETRAPAGHTFGVTYRADFGRFWSSRADDYDDQMVIADANLIFTPRARFALRFEYLDFHDPRGSTDRPFGSSPDVYHAPAIGGLFTYGSPESDGRIEVEAGRQNRRYANNRFFTVLADRDTTYFGGAFYWRALPATVLFIDARQSDIDYKSPVSTLDSTERRYRAGVTWEATAQTSGIFRIGLLEKDFDSALRQDFSGTSWQGTLRWVPRASSPDSVFEFTTAKETFEATGVGDYILSRMIYGTWNHAWGSRVRSNALLGFRTDDFRGTGGGRSDDSTSIGAGVFYEMRRWLTLGAQYLHTNRSSNTPLFEYDRNILTLSLGLTM